MKREEAIERLKQNKSAAEFYVEIAQNIKPIENELKDIEAFDMAIEALSDRPRGEWIDKGDYAVCSECGGSSGTQFDGVERTPRTTAFCPHCGARMKGADDE